MTMLNKPVMVLNKVWLPVRIIPAYRALILVFAKKASAIDGDTFYAYKWEDWVKEPIKDTDEVIKATNYSVKIPELIVLSTYDKVFKKDVRLTKKNIFIRDGNICQYTGEKMKASEADIDHVIPRAQGGENSWPNLVVCSKEINRKKADRTPEQAGLKLIRQPSKPSPDKLLIDPKINRPESWDKVLGNK